MIFSDVDSLLISMEIGANIFTKFMVQMRISTACRCWNWSFSVLFRSGVDYYLMTVHRLLPTKLLLSDASRMLPPVNLLLGLDSRTTLALLNLLLQLSRIKEVSNVNWLKKTFNRHQSPKNAQDNPYTISCRCWE